MPASKTYSPAQRLRMNLAASAGLRAANKYGNPALAKSSHRLRKIAEGQPDPWKVSSPETDLELERVAPLEREIPPEV